MDKILKCDYSVAVPDLQIRGRWGEGPGHPEPEIREVGASLNKNKGELAPPGPSPGSATAIKKKDTELHCPKVFHYLLCYIKWF